MTIAKLESPLLSKRTIPRLAKKAKVVPKKTQFWSDSWKISGGKPSILG